VSARARLPNRRQSETLDFEHGGHRFTLTGSRFPGGDIVELFLSSLVGSPREFNRGGTSFVCPITQGGNYARSQGFAVSLSGAGTNAQGVILCNQPRVLDIAARGGRFSEKAPEYIVDEVIAKLQTLLD
jgi:mRNA interferase ChpB